MAETSWDADPDRYDRLDIYDADLKRYLFDGTKVTVEGVAGIAKFDVKEAPGTDGASIAYKGYTPAKPSVTWEIWNPELELAYIDLWNIAPRPGKTAPRPITVVHPSLALARLATFYMEDLSLLKKVGPGIFSVTMKLVEYFPAPKVSPKPKKAGDITSVPVAKALQAPTVPPKPSTSKAGNAP